MGPFKRKMTPTRGPREIRFLFEEINRQKATLEQVAERSGYTPHGIMRLRRQGSGTFALVAAIGEALGYKLRWVPK